MDQITSDLASFASALTFADLDAETVHAGVQHLVDTLGCGLGAAACANAAIGRRIAAGQVPGAIKGRVLFHGETLPLEAAGFVNSAMIRNFDFNDRYPGGHPSDGLGPHLAHAGAEPVSGAAFLAAMTVTYEIFARLSDSTQLSRNGWDQGFAVGIATAAGMCNLLGLGVEETANAIGIMAASSVPLRVTRSGELTPWKNAATAYAARNGAFAALLAREGMAGPPNAFDGRSGLFEKVTGPFDLAPFPGGGGGPALLPRVQIKYWPIETNGQAAVWAALELREKIAPEAIAGIEVFTSTFTKFEIGSEPEKWDPQTRETADHSLPYILARALVDGPITVASFADEAVRDPALRPLMAKIKVTVDEDIDAAAAERVIMRVAVTLEDGTTEQVEVVNPLGDPRNPMNDDDIAAKFLALGGPIIGEARCREALDALWRAESAPELAPLLARLDLAPA